MADINKLKPFILKWEGGFVNDKKDLGGRRQQQRKTPMPGEGAATKMKVRW